MDFGPTSMEKETFGRADGTCFEREADAGPAGTSIDDRSFVRVARGAVVLIEGRARRVDDSKNELGRMPIEDFRPADRKSRFRCSPRWRPADVSMWVYGRGRRRRRRRKDVARRCVRAEQEEHGRAKRARGHRGHFARVGQHAIPAA